MIDDIRQTAIDVGYNPGYRLVGFKHRSPRRDGLPLDKCVETGVFHRPGFNTDLSLLLGEFKQSFIIGKRRVVLLGMLYKFFKSLGQLGWNPPGFQSPGNNLLVSLGRTHPLIDCFRMDFAADTRQSRKAPGNPSRMIGHGFNHRRHLFGQGFFQATLGGYSIRMKPWLKLRNLLGRDLAGILDIYRIGQDLFMEDGIASDCGITLCGQHHDVFQQTSAVSLISRFNRMISSFKFAYIRPAPISLPSFQLVNFLQRGKAQPA